MNQRTCDTELDRLFRSALGTHPRRATVGLGAMTVSEKDGTYRVEIDLPGFTMEDLDVSLIENELRLKGERKFVEDAEATYHLRSSRRAKLEETLRFPVEIDAEGVQAVLTAGVLTITLAKAPSSQPRRIEVRQTDA